MVLNECYTLKNGVKIPKLGLGTWFIENSSVSDAICTAAEIGYRHIDTAQAYENEQGVGDGVRKCGISRYKVFVTTKLAAEIKTYEEAVKSIDRSLKTMGLDYIDMMLIHSPEPWTDFRGGNYDDGNRQVWRALEEAYKSGKLRAIGVSNFKQTDIDNILADCTVAPMVNQLLVHISNTPTKLMEYSESKGMLVEAYSPVAHGKILQNSDIAAVAEKYGVTPAQLCIRYAVQLGTLPIPKSNTPEHMKENADIDFSVSSEDMEILKNIPRIENYGEFSHFPVFSGK